MESIIDTCMESFTHNINDRNPILTLFINYDYKVACRILEVILGIGYKLRHCSLLS